jgi:hypothetical protein
MRSFTYLVLASVVLVAACDKSDESGGTKTTSATTAAPAQPPKTAEPTPAAPPATTAAAPAAAAGGVTLTVAQLEDAKKSVRGGQPFTEAAPALFAKLGPPTGKVGDKKIFWRAIEGDKCARLEVEKDGANVGKVSMSSVDKLMKSQFEECAK